MVLRYTLVMCMQQVSEGIYNLLYYSDVEKKFIKVYFLQNFHICTFENPSFVLFKIISWQQQSFLGEEEFVLVS